MFLNPEEIKEWARGDLRRTLESEGVPQHEQDEAIERSLPQWLACSLMTVLSSITLADGMIADDYARRQMWNF